MKPGLFLLLCVGHALDNGLGLTPQMGFSTWNAAGSTVNESYVKAVARYLNSSGLLAKGYQYLNVDEGWMIGRDNATLEPIADPRAFPSGMKALGDFVHARGLRYGLYTSRGATQCARPEYQKRCLHTPPNPPAGCEGSLGYEDGDARWFAAQGADYLKEDSCSGSQNHSVAFAQYAAMRDALNRTGRPVFFSLCGWNAWYAPAGASLGNSWRISGDGKGWGPLTAAVNTMANLTRTVPQAAGGFSDPDLLIGPTCSIEGVPCGQTDAQARTQFALWAILPAPLLISQDVLAWTDYARSTYSNSLLIDMNQERLGDGGSRPARRLHGGDLSYPCTPPGGGGQQAPTTIAAAPCGAREHAGQQSWQLHRGLLDAPPPPPATGMWYVSLRGDSPGRRALGLQDSGVPCAVVNNKTRCALRLRPQLEDDELVNGQWLFSNKGTKGTNGTLTLDWPRYEKGACLDVWEGSGAFARGVDVGLFPCNGGRNQEWTYDPATGYLRAAAGTGTDAGTGMDVCLTHLPRAAAAGGAGAGFDDDFFGPDDDSSERPGPPSCTNVWGRELAGGRRALVFINNGPATANVTCDLTCFRRMGMYDAGVYRVTDVYDAARSPATLKPYNVGSYTFTASVDGDGGSRAFALDPVPTPAPTPPGPGTCACGQFCRSCYVVPNVCAKPCVCQGGGFGVTPQCVPPPSPAPALQQASST